MTTNPHQVMFSYWEMVILVGIVRNKHLLLCYQHKLDIWQIHKQLHKQCGFSSLFESIGASQMKPIIIYDNNQSCISLLKNKVFHICMKY
jgi:hypothetical protein